MRLVEGRATVEDIDDFVAALSAIGDEHDVAVVALSARYVTGRRHLERAVDLANRAWARDGAIARDRAVEICCYAAGHRQIERALEITVGAGETPAVVVIDAGPDPDPGAEDRERAAAETVAARLDPASTLGEYDADLVRDYFDVSDAELDATAADLPALVRERVALLVVNR